MHLRNEDSPVAEHLNSSALSEADMAVMVIDQLQNYNPCLHEIKEGRWIKTLRTSAPLWKNLRVDSF